MRAAVYTLGCKLNQCESEALASTFDRRGFFIGSYKDEADIYIINTCTVTTKAEQKARRVIRKLAAEHPCSAIVVTGCYAQLDRKELELAGNVIVVSNDSKDDINALPEYLQSIPRASGAGIADTVKDYFSARGFKTDDDIPADGAGSPDRFWYDSVDFNYHTRAFLKIQDGCDNSCAYCRVTIARGPSVSLSPEAVLAGFERLQRDGYREVVLTGVNLTSYNYGGVNFSSLLSMLTEKAGKKVPGRPGGSGKPGGLRIRLSSLEPETIDLRLAGAVSSEAVCPHFHIPVQSGSSRILKLMNRNNDRQSIVEAVNILRSVKDDPFMAADIIAGFPGETDADFEETCSLIVECDLTRLHVFPFSPRPGTAAFSMRGKVPERVSRERTAILRKLSVENFRRYLERWEGRQIKVLLEEQKPGYWLGTSENYLKSAVCDIIKKEGGVCMAEIDSNLCGGMGLPAETSGCRFIEWT